MPADTSRRLRRVRPLPPVRRAPGDMCRFCFGRGWRDYYDGLGTHLGEKMCRSCKGSGRDESQPDSDRADKPDAPLSDDPAHTGGAS